MIRISSAMAAVATVLVITSASSVSAQSAKKLAPGDTLRFNQKMKIAQDVDAGAQGQMNITNTMDMTFAMNAVKDTVTMWIEKATSAMDSPMGNMSPDISAILNKPFKMVIGADGNIKTISMPDFAANDPNLAGLMPDSSQFGFAFHHPADLHVGVTWTDTMVVKPKEGAKQQMNSTTITVYTVAGDSTINGYHVFAVNGDAVANVNMTMSMDPMTMNMVSKTATKGRYFYSPDLHMVIESATTGTGDSKQHIEGPMTLDTSSKQTLESTTKMIH